MIQIQKSPCGPGMSRAKIFKDTHKNPIILDMDFQFETLYFEKNSDTNMWFERFFDFFQSNWIGDLIPFFVDLYSLLRS